LGTPIFKKGVAFVFKVKAHERSVRVSVRCQKPEKSPASPVHKFRCPQAMPKPSAVSLMLLTTSTRL
jgi:hypothetical protein